MDAPVRVVAITEADESLIEAARALFLEYAASLDVDLAFQDFETEMDRFPSGYLSPDGTILIANSKGAHLGCVGVRRLDQNVCEMKRLYVRPAARGGGVGRRLAEAATDAARQLRYRRMRLDTLPTMGEARELYAKMGFREIAPYYHNPIKGTRYMELDL